MQKVTITISGKISGEIWMPFEHCVKSFRVTFTPKESHVPFTKEWTGLRDALLDITNDGDFRNAKIDYAIIETVYYQTAADRSYPYRFLGETKTIRKDLVAGKLIADCFNID